MKFKSLFFKSAIFASTLAGTTTKASESPQEINDHDNQRKILAIREIQLEAEALSDLTAEEKKYLNYLLEKVKRGSVMREAIDCEIGL